MRCKHVARGLVSGVRLLLGLLVVAVIYVGIHCAQRSAKEGLDVQALVAGRAGEALLVLNQSNANGRLQLERGYNGRAFVRLNGNDKV